MTHPTEPVTRPDALPPVVRTVVDIAAPPAQVFEALTDPRELAAWWGGDGARTLDSQADARPGGAWRIRTVDPDGTERTVGGEYRVVDAPSRLEHTWRAADDAATSVVRYDLEPLVVDGADGTRLTVTHRAPTALASTLSLAARGAALAALAALVVGARDARERPGATARPRPAWCPVWCLAPRRPAWARRGAPAGTA